MSLGAWSPWNQWEFSILQTLGLKQSTDYSGMQVYALAGQVEVEIDGEVVGNVSVDGSPLDIYEIEPGEHLVSVSRIPDDNSNDPIYYQLNRVLSFKKGINTVLAYEIGPSEEFSSGYIITSSDAIDKDKNYLNIIVAQEDARIFINDIDAGITPLSNYEIRLDQTYKIRVEKDNYETIEFDLLPEDEDQKKLLEDSDISVEINLFQLPIEIVNTDE